MYEVLALFPMICENFLVNPSETKALSNVALSTARPLVLLKNDPDADSVVSRVSEFDPSL